MTNRDVIALVNAKLGDSIIISKIKASECGFDTSTAGLIALKRAGASNVVISTVMNCGTAQAPAAAPARTALPALQSRPAAPAPAATSLFLPQGTWIYASLTTQISTKTARPGDHFTASVSQQVAASTGIAIPVGSVLSGVVAQATRGGHFGGHGNLRLEYDSLTIPGGATYPLQATWMAAGQQAINQEEGTARSSGSSAVRDTVVGGVAGVALGALFGGAKGALRAGAIGAGGGLALGAFTSGQDVTLPAGTAVSIRLNAPLAISEP